MTTSTATPATHCVTNAEQDSDLVHRSAFYLPGRAEPVFAWLHGNPSRSLVDHGVLICPPIGHEQLHSHRSLRSLADRLARNSIPTVRFDWHGTGDSPGNDEDPKRVTTWLANIEDSVKWMRENLGCRKISLIGLRIGGTLAALASKQCDIENLVLWSPVVKGRMYVREMKALSLTSEAAAHASETPGADLESGGFVLTSETAQDLSAINLGTSQPACSRVLLVSRADLPADERLRQEWLQCGCAVQQVAAPGYAEMMTEPHRGQIPHAAIQQITDWLLPAMTVDAAQLRPDEGVTRRHSVTLPSTLSTSDPNARIFVLEESAFWISKNPRLFGIVTEPQIPELNSKPTIVLLNAGAANHVAPSRLYTLLARRLAREGFRCLRIDLSGLGDSAQDSTDHENDSYPSTAFRDIDLAIKQIQEQFATERIVLMGLCSGAYAAFQSAAQIQNSALIESILINPLTYFWKDGMTLDASPTKHLMSFHYYQKMLLDPRKWWKFFSGQSRIGLKGALKIVGQMCGLIKLPHQLEADESNNTHSKRELSHPVCEDTTGDLRRIIGFQRRLALFFSQSDPGFAILNHHAGRLVRELRANGALRVSFIDAADHTFSRRAARNELIDAIAEYLRLTNREVHSPIS